MLAGYEMDVGIKDSCTLPAAPEMMQLQAAHIGPTPRVLPGGFTRGFYQAAKGAGYSTKHSRHP